MSLNVLQLIDVASKVSAIAKNAPASGVKSTEFWLTSVVSLYGVLGPAVPPPYNVVIPLVAVSVYTLARTILKAAHAFGALQQVPELPDLNPVAPAAGPSVQAPNP